MRVLVTGATGFAGSHAAVALARAGHSLRCLARSADKVRAVFEARGVAMPDVVVGDMTDAAAVERALAGVDAVVHAAGVVSIESRHADQVLRANVQGTELVVGGAAERGVPRIVYLSSLSAIFDPGAALCADSPVAPAASPYSLSKARSEEYVRGLQARGAPVATLYPSAIQGPDDPGLSESNFALLTFVRDCILHTSGGYLAVDVRDLAAAVRALLEAGRPGRYLATGHFLPWRELGELLGELGGRRIRAVPGPGWLFRALGRAGDLAKRLVPFGFPMTREAMQFATRLRPVASSAELAELGIAFRDPRETYEDSLRWLVAAGHLAPRLVPRLAPAPGPRASA